MPFLPIHASRSPIFRAARRHLLPTALLTLMGCGAAWASPPPAAACQAWALLERAQGESVRAWAGDGSAWARLRDVQQDVQAMALQREPGMDARLREPFLRSLAGVLAAADTVRAVQAATLRVQAAEPAWLQAVEALQSAQGAGQAGLAQQVAAGQLAMLTQRLTRSAGEVFGLGPLKPEAVFLIGRDSASFATLLRALEQGDATLGLKPTPPGAQREALKRLRAAYEPVAAALNPVLSNLSALAATREAVQQLHSQREAWAGPMRARCTAN
jgi:hypothetical protein